MARGVGWGGRRFNTSENHVLINGELQPKKKQKVPGKASRGECGLIPWRLAS